MKVYIGADHRGFNLKKKIAKWLRSWGFDFFDVGAKRFEKDDDYTVYASKVSKLVSQNKDSRGILICGSGVGVDVVANKFDGIRASVGKSLEQVKAGRNDDDMNILVLAADYTSEDEAREMTKAFLETRFGGKEKYKRRLYQIKKIEENN